MFHIIINNVRNNKFVAAKYKQVGGQKLLPKNRGKGKVLEKHK